MKKLLILGATGFIGQNLVNFLIVRAATRLLDTV